MPTDLAQRIEAIRRRRAKMEQFGPLSVGLTPGSHRSFVIVKGDIGLEANCGVVGERNSAKAEFFANAPTDIDFLLAEYERLEREVAELSAVVTFLSKYTEHTIPLDELREQLGIKT